MSLDDDASMREDQFRDAALLQRKPVGPTAVGHCLYCRAELAAGIRWCNDWCRDEYMLEQEAKVRNRGRL